MFDDFEFLLGFVDFKKTKKVSFSQILNLYLIPMIDEFMNYQDLWWSEEDLIEMRKSAMVELKKMMELNPLMELKYAKKILYQPNNIVYDTQNFENYE